MDNAKRLVYQLLVEFSQKLSQTITVYVVIELP